MKIYNEKFPKEVLWDMSIADTAHGVSLKMHEPVRKGAALVGEKAWEGEHCCYGQVIFDGEKYRLYYRGAGGNDGVWQTANGSHSLWCVAYSYDGKTFEKPDLQIYEYNGSYHNNIIMKWGSEYLDNFSIFLDTNPDCPPEKKYKAMSGYTYNWEKDDVALKLFTSPDGLHFTYEGDMLRGRGKFDSLNICFWDEETGKYRLYMRDYHQLDPAKALDCEFEKHVRDIQLSTSEDFVNWSDPTPLSYGDDPYEFQLYTNNIFRYPETDAFIGMPTRYVDRSVDKPNYAYLPDLRGFRPMLIEKYGRSGTAITETMIMTSRDGQNFERTPEAFYSPGLENGENWVYGDGYFAYGMIETESDFEGEPNELSFYVIKGYRSRPANFERYTLRKDGFFSWRADFGGGEIVTKPFTFDGSELLLNFSTSALGYVRIEILDEDGSAIEGYDSGRIFGNSVARPCDFTSPISALAGKPIRFKITMRDADLYSFKFCK